MQRVTLATVFGLLLFSSIAVSATNHFDTVKMHSWSVRFDTVHTNFFNVDYLLRFSSQGSAWTTGELEVDPNSNSTNTLRGFYELSSGSAAQPLKVAGEFAVDLPPYVDGDGDGLDDFFESNREIAPVQTAGVFRDPVGGDVRMTATWSRADKGNFGIVEFQMASPAIGLTITFRARFEVFYFVGNLQFKTGTGIGALSLSRFLQGTYTLDGSPGFARNTYGNLISLPFTLTSSQGLDLVAPGSSGVVSGGGTNWIELHFNDGDPNTVEPDLQNWRMVFPDASLADILAPSSGPKLLINRDGSALSLGISPANGANYRLEESTRPDLGWSLSSVVQATNGLAIPIALQSSAARFFRLKSP